MNTIRSQPARAALVLAAAAALAACAAVPLSNPRLDEARAAYDAAAADAEVIRIAPVELQQAQQALRQAQTALQAGDDAAVVDHYAYLARRRTETAMQAGKIAQAEQAVAQSRARRDQILIQARTREADAQSASAEQARAAAEKARARAEAASELAEKRLAAAELARGQAESALQQAEAAKSRAGTLEAELAEMKARKTDRGMVLTLGDVLFDFGQTTLKPGATRTIGQLAEFLTRNPTRNVLIEGHTDSIGGEEFNRELSQRRAEAVREALIELRIGGERVEVSGLGKDYPVASNDTPAGRQQNRRVEVIFSDDSGAIQQRK